MTKYWKGKPWTIKNGQCGTMDNNGFVPDSIEITKSQYDKWVVSQPKQISPAKKDIDKLVIYAKKQNWI